MAAHLSCPATNRLFSFCTSSYASVDEGKTVDATQSWFDCGSCAHLVCAMTTLRLLEVDI